MKKILMNRKKYLAGLADEKKKGSGKAQKTLRPIFAR